MAAVRRCRRSGDPTWTLEKPWGCRTAAFFVFLLLFVTLAVGGLVFGWMRYEKSLDAVKFPHIVRLLLTMLGLIAVLVATPAIIGVMLMLADSLADSLGG